MARRAFLGSAIVSAVIGLALASPVRGGDATPDLDRDVLPLLKLRCVKCHGPARREGRLNLASARSLARGGKHGPVVTAGRQGEAALWGRVASDEMPPEEPLSDDEKARLRRWVEAGAPGLPVVKPGEPETSDHWAFAPLSKLPVPTLRDSGRVRSTIDAFLLAALEREKLTFAPDAERATLVRRVSFDLTGLPPTPEEVTAYVSDRAPDAYERMVERSLSSPRYGERWGKFWLDAAGYADSNGYFNADTDRPLAYRYRDLVIRAHNADVPFDAFLRDQLAGDEISGYRRGKPATPAQVDRLVATHMLRNGPDGTGESDGNDDELRADRFAVLEGAIEILGASVFGLTFQCARCHDHKFEPVTQADYYRLQAVLYPAFPVEAWAKPNDRVAEAATPAELAAWEARRAEIDREIAALRADYRTWTEKNRETGTVVFRDDFGGPNARLAPRWSATAPGDDAPGGKTPVAVDGSTAPSAFVRDGTLCLLESGGPGNRWLSTSQAFDWTPDQEGGWVQVTFDLVDRAGRPGGPQAERIGYYLALHDYQDDGPTAGGNVLIDGNPAGGAAVQVDYPGADARPVGAVGQAGYEAGHRYGVRVTNAGRGKFRLEHLVDWAAEGKSVTLEAADLPDGGFGFELCCGRSFVVDDLRVETGGPSRGADRAAAQARKARRETFEKQVKALEARRGEKPGRVSWVADLSPRPPATHLLRRGNYNDRGPVVEPGVPAVLTDPDNPFQPASDGQTTGRRKAFANWLTKPGSRAAALLARVTVNRVWQQHFGVGLVATPENLGYSGASPTNSGLLDHLAGEFVASGWSLKSLHRRILTSTAYRQSSVTSDAARVADPDDRLLSRFPVRRLDAEAVRDAMLAVSGEIDLRPGGPYVPSTRNAEGEVDVPESTPGARRRSVYLQQRRTQVVGMLETFDAPSLVTSCTRRNATTVPLQSLSLLNSDFVRARARGLADRVVREAGGEEGPRVERTFALAVGRPPTAAEREAAARFVAEQPSRYAGRKDADRLAWVDFCQMVLASNAFLYVD